MELYSTIMAECIFQKPSIQDQQSIQTHIDTMNKLALEGPWKEGIICTNYCPKDTRIILK